ncbi:MAG: D-glycero-alpha-D-manno-heptose-1,7-bisphosphate 7-phosphatase [Phycisphaeraceae bacterium]
MQPAVFLDLDNTIMESTESLTDLATVSLIKGAAPAIASLRGLGYRVVVVANHEGIARGQVTEEDVHVLHARVAELIEKTANGAVIDAFYYCPFHPRGQLKKYKKDHRTRKPKPGMLEQAAEEMKLDLNTSWMIGDELADVQAGHAAGARTILLRPDAERLMPVDLDTIEGVTSDPPDRDRPTGPDFFAVSLVDAARLIAQQPRVEQTEPKSPTPGRKWDAEKIAKIQVARPAKPAGKEQTVPTSTKAFRPWGAPTNEDDDTPIVAKPFRKRQHAEAEVAQPTVAEAVAPSPPTQQAVAPVEIPENIRQAIEQKKAAKAQKPDSESDKKTLRLILHELRAQRGQDQEFSFLTIIAVALQLVAIICLLGGLFMGGTDDGVFLRWLGTGIMAQLIAIATLIYGR